MEKVILKTNDGVDIAADYYYAKPSRRGALLLHMMPADRKSWWDFALRLEDAGYRVLAIDLRGHGESSGPPGGEASGPDGYKKFSDEEHQKSTLDVEAGVLFLEEEGVEREHTVLVGASIGANLALWYAAEHPEIKRLALLSPGLNYRGIEAEPLARKLHEGQGALFVTSLDDVRSGGSNTEMNQILYNLVPHHARKKLIIYKAAGHGTDMFGKEEPDLAGEILEWIQKK